MVEAFGGVRRAARLLGVCPSTVSRWTEGDGLIPQRQWVHVLDVAAKNGVALQFSDLIPLCLTVCNSVTTKKICSEEPELHCGTTTAR